MKERPILFSAPMIRALLEGRKTQTRRIISVQPSHPSGTERWGFIVSSTDRKSRDRWSCKAVDEKDGHAYTERGREKELALLKCPYGNYGDRLWVRETWLQTDGMTSVPDLYYRASESEENAKQLAPWKPSIFMPRWASRILLEITDIRVQRVQEISEEDGEAEGCGTEFSNERGMSFRDGFLRTFYDLNKRAPRSENPWVWAITFHRVSP